MDPDPAIMRKNKEANGIAEQKGIEGNAINEDIPVIGLYLIDPCILFAYDDPCLSLGTPNEQNS